MRPIINNKKMKIYNGNPENLNKIYGQNNRPGESIGKTIEEVRKEYILCRKLYSEQYQLNIGANNNLTVNLPANARFLIGISVYSPFQNDNESPTINYKLNNSYLIQQTPIRTLLVSNLQSQVFYPLGLSLSGQDQHIVDINNVAQAKVTSVILHYI